MASKSPAVRIVLLFAAGIILAEWIRIEPLCLITINAALLIFSIVLVATKKLKFLSGFVLQVLLVLSGTLLQSLQRSEFNSLRLEPVIEDEKTVVFGIVDSEPALQAEKMSFVVQADSIRRQRGNDRIRRRIMITIRHPEADSLPGKIRVGSRIVLAGCIEPFPFQRNPFEIDYGKFLALNDIQGVVLVNSPEKVRIQDAGGEISFASWKYTAQCSLYGILDRLHSPRHASFLKGIIFGYRAEIPTDVKKSFIDTGTVHILAVSGSNVVFVAMIFFSIFGFFRLPRKAIVIVSIIGLIIYMIITGSSPSVVRATIMAAVIICGAFFERKSNIYNSISVAALLLLIWNANNLFDVGFQLSFAAVISIVYFYPKLESLIKKIPEKFEEIKALDFTLKLLAVSLAAQLGTAPFTGYYFGRASVISLLANIPVVPISGLNTMIGAAEIIFFPFSPSISQMYAAANDFLVWFMLGFVKEAADMPFSYIEISHLDQAIVAIYYSILLLAFNLQKARIRNIAFIAIMALANYHIYESIFSSSNRNLRVTLIDVGQGDAILLEFPGGKKLLVDSGPVSPKYDAGERVIVPFLKKQGIMNLEYLLITHSHNDHIGGVQSILRMIQVDTIVLNHSSRTNYLETGVLDLANQKKIGVKSAKLGDRIDVGPDVRIYVLHPDLHSVNLRNQNNSSIVLKVQYGTVSMLLAGDAEKEAESLMADRYGSFLNCEILKVSHHGSATGTVDKILYYVRPAKAVISVGVHNKFRHPSPATIRRLRTYTSEVDRTDRSGAIILETDGRRCFRREWRSEL